MSSTANHRVAILWRGDRTARATATPENNRYHRIFEELRALGIHAEPAVYGDDFADDVRAQLMAVDGVLVWVNPLDDGRTREKLDALLRDVASKGTWVSAHPDVILKMGTKEVLYRTKHLGWGTDTHLYCTPADFREAFPARLRSSGPRVIKQNRGNAGQGVWKVECSEQPDVVSVLEAQRGSMPEQISLREFLARCETYFAWGGCIIDQPFQPRLPEGMIRCYMGADKVVGLAINSYGVDHAAPRWAGFTHGTARPAYHAWPRCSCLSGTTKENGNGVDAADEGGPRDRCLLAPHHLGCRLSPRPAHCCG